jgi:hypothetical protein
MTPEEQSRVEELERKVSSLEIFRFVILVFVGFALTVSVFIAAKV